MIQFYSTITSTGGGGGGKQSTVGKPGWFRWWWSWRCRSPSAGGPLVDTPAPCLGSDQVVIGGSGSPNYTGGGGGGAGAVGAGNPPASVGGDGGVGLSNSITGTATFYAGGGGGSHYSGPAQPVTFFRWCWRKWRRRSCFY